MHEKTIGLLAAMPEEIGPLLKLVGPYAHERRGKLNLYRFTIGNQAVCLIESGMGPLNAATATHALLDAANPCLIVSFGFAGAVTAGPLVGDIVLANRLLFHHERLFSEQLGLATELADQATIAIDQLLRHVNCQLYHGAFITAAQILGKKELAKQLPAGLINPVVEMETTAVARVAARAKVPLLAIRAISDAADEELGFNIADFTDRTMRIRLWRVLLTVAQKPWIIPQLLRLAANTRRGGKHLALALLGLMRYLAQQSPGDLTP